MPLSNINGYRLYYADSGKGTPIIFIHPPVLTSLNFLYQMKQLSTGFRTVSLDIRGHGSSEPSSQEITYPLIVKDILQLMDQLKIGKAFLCGYSTGGSVVLEFLLTHPERALGGIIISGMSEVRDDKLRTRIARGRFMSQIGAVGAIALSTAWSQAAPKFSLMRILFNDAKRTNPKNAEQYYQFSLQYNCTGRLGEIRQPILLLYGEEDISFHPYAKLLHEHLPLNELVLIPQTKHQLPTKAAGTVNHLIEQFIQRCTLNSVP